MSPAIAGLIFLFLVRLGRFFRLRIGFGLFGSTLLSVLVLLGELVAMSVAGSLFFFGH